MNTLFYSRKGGQGKTTLAVLYARHSTANLVTFDYDNGTRELYEDLISEGAFHQLTPADPLRAEEGESHVFDFGGYLDEKIITTAKVCDQCVIPISYQSSAEIKPFIDTVTELSKHNSNITIVINNTDREHLVELREALQTQFSFPTFVIPKSKFVSKLSLYKKTPIELLAGKEVSLLQRHHLKKLAPTFQEFFDYLSKDK